MRRFLRDASQVVSTTAIQTVPEAFSRVHRDIRHRISTYRHQASIVIGENSSPAKIALPFAAAVAGAATREVPVVVLDVVGEAHDVLHAAAARAHKRASGAVKLGVFSLLCLSPKCAVVQGDGDTLH